MSFSNTNDDIFVLTMPSQVDRGALMSRYSRSKKDMREIYNMEFATNPNRGTEFYQKVLSQYGDDSIAELGTAQIAIENISNIAAQKIEDRRIGFSFLEKSSRYVSWADKPYKYYMGADIEQSEYADIYKESCEFSFDTYVKLNEELTKYIHEKWPIEIFADLDKADSKKAHKIYDNVVKSKVLDISRGLLPAGTKTNVAITGNGRAFEYLISVLLADPLEECQQIGNCIYNELQKTMGPFIQRAKSMHGHKMKRYLAMLKDLKPDKYRPPINWPREGQNVKLIKGPKESRAMEHIVAGMLLENNLFQRYETALKYASTEMARFELNDFLDQISDLRQNRRQKLPRSFEWPEFTFDIECDYGIFRDLHRHRILTLQRGDLTAFNPYTIHPMVLACGMHPHYIDAMEKSRITHQQMSHKMPKEAQYVVNFGFKYNFMIKVNFRELCHIVELRTLPQGHSEYRSIVQQMYHCVKVKHPILIKMMKFANLENEEFGRLKAEIRAANK